MQYSIRTSWKKNFFEVSIFKQGDVVKLMLRKWYKIGFRMFLKVLWRKNFENWS